MRKKIKALFRKLFSIRVVVRIVLDEGSAEFKELKKVWLEQARKQTLRTLPEFLRHLLHDYTHDYGTICHAIAAGGEATMWALNREPQGGITGFQGGAVMWEFVRSWRFSGNRCGLRLVDFDNMLYPQYAYEFNKTISEDIWKAIQAEAKERLAAADASPINEYARAVVEHWRTIAAGVVPFGYTVRES